MTGAQMFGYALISLSAAFFAMHWRQWRDGARESSSARRREFIRQQVQRRMVASGLIGVVGAALTLIDQLPPQALAMTAYLCALLLAGGVILAIALADMRASRRLHEEEQIDLLAAELRKATAERS